MSAFSPDHRRFALNILGTRKRGRVRLEGNVFAGLPPDRRRAAFELVQGVRRNTFLLDAVLRQFLTRPVRQVPPRVRDALRLGLYEMMFHTTVSASSVVSQVVSLAGKNPSLRGLVNAVLRRASEAITRIERAEDDRARDRHTVWVGPGRGVRFSVPVLPDPSEDLVSWHALQYTLIRSFVESLIELLPLEHEDLFRALNTPRPVTLRPTRRSGSIAALQKLLEAEGVTETAVRGTVLEILTDVPIRRLSAIRDGTALVQDTTAAEVAPFVNPQPGESVLDLCAAPGGKTVHMAELMNDTGEIVAADKSAGKLEMLRENAERQDLSCISICEVSPDGAGLPDGLFDRVLVDAPCSNTGVLMRKVDARYRVGEENLERLEELQLKLLTRGAQYVKDGGSLVYSTCSIIPEENQALVRQFLSQSPEFKLDEERLHYPHHTLRDGGYMARLLRNAREPEADI